MYKKVSGIVIVVVAFTVGWQVVSQRQAVPTKDLDGLQKVTIAEAYEVFLYAPLYVAQEQGFYRDEGLDVSIVTAGGDDKAFAALLSGDAQFSVGDPTFAAVSGEKGQPGMVVGAVLDGVPFWGVAKGDIPVIGKPSDLGSYRVATFPSPSTASALQTQMFVAGGLTPNIREMAPGTLLPALERGDVDIALEVEPNVSMAASTGNHVVYSLSDAYPDFAMTGIVVLPGYVDTDAATAQKLVNAIHRADVFIRSHPEEAGKILAQQFAVPEHVATDALKNIVAANIIPQDMRVSADGWQAAIGLRQAAGDLKGSAPFGTYVTNRFAAQQE